ncbi:Spy/CpxP family protein refolding chaperone [Devosia sp. SL43]|uniref:Spy/CpxP family protein refolding chaperone n=1 Tax=Devosia sp. SL43 TaxID=2806348 RepID=UPI001F2A1F30|nr:Spy/CpxP family protein refolding chaperone [Devosia sp. SL43]UJW86800.1 Spy/CpxP family protein refolding chaperone [Devosia sp. SL43]
MKTITKTAIVALMTAAVGFTAIAPTFAQDATPAPTQEQAFRQGGPGSHLRQDRNGPGRGGFLEFFGPGTSTEAIEIALVRLSHAIELTTEQQALFDTLKIDALAAAETFSTAVEGLRPTPVEGQTAERPEFSEMFENRIALETAHLAALEAVQPSLTAFFDSLTDEQKAELLPQRPNRNGGQHQGQMHKGPMGTPAQAPAPNNG